MGRWGWVGCAGARLGRVFMKRSPTALQVIKEAQRFVVMIRVGTTREIVDRAIQLDHMIRRFWNHSNYRNSLEKVDTHYQMKREGAKLARKQLVSVVKGWEGSGNTFGQLLFQLQTMRIELDDDNNQSERD
jgi:hypothetical protein